MLVSINSVSYNAKPYPLPKKGNAPEGFHLIIAGEKVPAAMTGGGKFPRYTYFVYAGASYYLPKDVVPATGDDVVILPQPVKEAKAVTPKAEAPAAEATAPAKKAPRAPKVTA